MHAPACDNGGMITRQTVHRSSSMQVHFVHCRPHDGACGPEEHACADLLVFPLRGVFVKHHAAGNRVVADARHALLFAANQPYRVSHPVAGGDECLVLEASPEMLGEIRTASSGAYRSMTRSSCDAVCSGTGCSGASLRA